MRIRSALVVAILAGIATTTPARADSVYAYWSYWQGDAGTWKYAVTGPATAPAVDGAVDGWRFTLGTDGKATMPVGSPDFAELCSDVPKVAGKARVGIVIDYGTASDQPPVHQCAVVASGLSRASALTSVATLRFNNGFICGINDVPQSGCGDAVAPTASPTTASPTPSASSTPSKPAEVTANSGATDSAAPTSSATTNPIPDSSSTPAAIPDASTAASSEADVSTGVESSPIATVVTMLLGTAVLLLALRNARRQKEQQ